MTAASDIVKKLRNGQNMRDLMRKTNLVMTAEPEKFVETEKGKNLVQYEAAINSRAGLGCGMLRTATYHCEFHHNFLKLIYDHADNDITAKTNMALGFRGASGKRRGSALFIWLRIVFLTTARQLFGKLHKIIN